MRRQSDRAQMGISRRLRKGRRQAFPRNAELGIGAAGGNLAVGARINCRVDAHCDFHHSAARRRNLCQHVDFGFGFDIELQDAGIDAGTKLGAGLANAGKHDAAGWNAGGQCARQFTAGNNISAGTQPGNGAEHGQIGIGFHRKGHQRVAITQPGHRGLEYAEMPFDRGTAVAVKRRANFGRKLCKADVFGMHHAAAKLKMIHCLSL